MNNQTLDSLLLCGDVEKRYLGRANCYECGGYCIHDEQMNRSMHMQMRQSKEDLKLRDDQYTNREVELRDDQYTNRYYYEEFTLQERIDASNVDKLHLNYDIVDKPHRVSREILGDERYKDL